MAFTIVSQTPLNFADGFSSTSFSQSVAATSGDGIILFMRWRKTAGITFTVPAWNGQSLTQYGSTFDDGESLNGLFWVQASATATVNLTGTFSNSVIACGSIVVVRPSSGTISVGGIQSQIFTGGVYTNPSVTVLAVPVGGAVISFLGHMGWDGGFGTVTTTFTPSGGLSGISSAHNTAYRGVWAVENANNVSSSGAVISSWSRSDSAEPQYMQVAFYLSTAAVATATLPTPVKVGSTGNVATTTVLGAVTSITNGTVTATGANTFTYTQNTFQNGVVYLPMGAQLLTVTDNAALTAAGASVLQTINGYTDVLMGAMNTGAYSLGKDPSIIPGSVIHAPTSAGTLNTDGTLTNYVFGSYACWMRDAVDGKMYSFILNVTNSGLSTTGLKISTRYIGSRTISLQKISNRNLR